MKRVVRMVAVAVLVAAAGWGSYVSGRQETKMTGLMLDNVEALATGEDANQVICWGIGSVDCPTTHRKVYRDKGRNLTDQGECVVP